jgi:CrcB protein
MPFWLWLAVGACGGTFAIARFLVDAVVSLRIASEFPWGTFVVNVSGSFVLGLIVGTALSGTALLLEGTASIGAYTTFSTWMFETHRLGEDDDRRPLLAYLVGTAVVGLAAATLGRALGRAL